MRRSLKYITYLLILISAIGCEENFSPEGKFYQDYVMNSIIRNDTSYQIATVLKTFPMNGEDDVNDNFIDSVFLRLWHSDEVYIFNDTTVSNSNGSNEKLKYYYIDNFVPEFGKEMEMEALLPNGRRLNATTMVPQKLTTDGISTDKIIPPREDDVFSSAWSFSGNFVVSDLLIELHYFLDNEPKTVEIPLEYIKRDGKLAPRYPRPAEYGSFAIDMSVIDQAMKNLGAGLTDKSRIKVRFVVVDILVYDRSLSSFYASNSNLRDDFSVRVDKPEYSNVEGGFGVFASFVRKKYTVNFQPVYIQSFGYKATILEP